MSTWLQEVFASTDGISYLHKSYFFSLYYQNFKEEREFYLNKFDTQPNDRIFLESDEHLLLSDFHNDILVNVTNLSSIVSMLDRILLLFPDAKFLIVIKNQRDLHISKYVQYIRGGGSLPVDEFLEELVFNQNYLKFADYRYSKVMDLFLERIEPQRLLVINMDSKDSRETVRTNIGSFFGVELTHHLHAPANVSTSYKGLLILRWINKAFIIRKKTIHARPKSRIGFTLWKLLHKLIEKLDETFVTNKEKEKIFNPEMLKKIEETFEADNLRLSETYGISVSKLDRT